MINTMLAFAPARVLGTGSVDVRPWGGVALPPADRPALLGAIAGVQGTRLPVAADARVRDAAPIGSCVTPHTTTKQFDQFDNGTTLGICFPGRPSS